jgi:peptide deformylase
MAILKVRKYKDPILRKKSSQIKKIDEEIKKIIVDMVQTMKQDGGVGLAAPQVGISKRIIVVETDLDNQRILVLVNPEIIEKSKDRDKEEEGCLSFPGIFLEIKRSKKIKVKGLDINGKKIELVAEGLLARVFQHEIDHLDGILFFDRLGIIKRILFKLKYPNGFN